MKLWAPSFCQTAASTSAPSCATVLKSQFIDRHSLWLPLQPVAQALNRIPELQMSLANAVKLHQVICRCKVVEDTSRHAVQTPERRWPKSTAEPDAESKGLAPPKWSVDIVRTNQAPRIGAELDTVLVPLTTR